MEFIEPKQDIKPDRNKARKLMAIRHTINSILNGGVYSVLESNLMEDEYGLGHCYSNSQAHKIIKEAREIIRKDTEEQMPSLKSDMLNRYLDIYTESREVGDRQSAIKSLEQINKLYGLFQDNVKIQADVKKEVVIDFGYGEREEDESEN